MHSHYLLKVVSHPRLEAQSPGSAGYKHLHVGHPDIYRGDIALKGLYEIKFFKIYFKV